MKESVKSFVDRGSGHTQGSGQSTDRGRLTPANQVEHLPRSGCSPDASTCGDA
ncbi:MAG TPA: hypothetical protein VFI97_08050 [Arthrobacter sp.]|nr:hypothetical protein [Arthrobacter sp.]